MDGRKTTVAAIQMSSTPEKAQNLATAEHLIHRAALAGAELVALPELWSCHGLEEAYGERMQNRSQDPPPAFSAGWLGNWACTY